MPELLPYEPGSPEWLAARRAGVTATDIVTILGLSRYDSPYSLFWRKMGQVPEVEDNDRFRLGHELDPYARDRWAQEQPGPWHFEGSGLYRHDTRSWQMATPDYRVGPGLDYREPLTAVLELKTWADADRRSWDGGPPAIVRAQVLWQMDVMDAGTGHVGVVFLPSGEFRSYVIEHEGGMLLAGEPCELPSSCEVCKDLALMRVAGEEFMARLRLELPPPDPDSSAATLAAVRARFSRQPAKQAEVPWLAFDQWNLSKREADRAAEQVRKYEIELRELIGEASEITVDGELVARRVVFDAQVKAHTRHQDYIRRVKQGDGNGADQDV